MNLYPDISIIIPVYNGSDYLSEAIDSALAQTYENVEILVINDGSNDGGKTEHIALSYRDKIRYFSQPNGGVASALNRAVVEMKGQYFSWLSHDDLYCEDKIQRAVDALNKEKDRRAIIYSDYYIFTNDPAVAIPIQLKGVPSEHFRYWLTTENVLHGCTLLIPKIAFDECGKFNERLRTTQDYDLWFRMAEKFRFFHISRPLVKARNHQAQGSIAMADVALEECNTLLSNFVTNLSVNELELVTKRSLALAYANIANSMFFRGFLSAGRVASALSLRHFYNAPLREKILVFFILVKGVPMRYFVRKFLKKMIPIQLKLGIKRLLASQSNSFKGFGPEHVQHMNLKDKFSEVYDKNIFRGRKSRSGEGSDHVQTEIIRVELPKLIKKLNICSFLDAPCGDWYWMHAVELGVEEYIGVDIVDSLIKKNQLQFSNEKINFHCMNLAESELPKVDLIFSRDCLVHLSFKDALKIIENFKRSGSKYLLTTTFKGRTKNEDLGTGFWRPLNKQLAPFNFPEPIHLINEGCSEEGNMFEDKCLGLWLLQDIPSLSQ